MKDQEITVGSRWKCRGTEIKILAVGLGKAFIRLEDNYETAWDISYVLEHCALIKGTKEFYLYTTLSGATIIEGIGFESDDYIYRSEHPITFVEVE